MDMAFKVAAVFLACGVVAVLTWLLTGKDAD